MAKKGLGYDQIMSDLRRKIYKPIYLLMGDEAYYIDKISDFIQQDVLDESQREFDLTVLYGKDADMVTIVNASKRYPMMSPYQVIIVKEAQQIKDWDALQFYLMHPPKTTILVFAYKYGAPDKRKKWVSDVDKLGIVFESTKLRDYELDSWIKDYARAKELVVEEKAIVMLKEFLGTDLSKVANELDKLLLTKPANTNRITPEQVERNIGISKDFNVFELQAAFIARDVLKANRIVRYFGENKKNNPMVMVLPQLFGFFANLMLYHYLADKSQGAVASDLKINPYFVKDYEKASKIYGPWKTMNIISWIRETDARGKGIESNNIDDAQLMKELVYKILH
ncbi:MAG: DNA polymerase III subunit delta [Porphyromonadaceae bacterium CG2_30_38_12]|nr:MAG: DNA polymerase III subunit delta [Porphyromonadaceae bacterium CG2_30_38_12]